MFPNGRCFLAQCCAVVEAPEGSGGDADVAVVVLGAEVATPPLQALASSLQAKARKKQVHRCGSSSNDSGSASSAVFPPAAEVADDAVSEGSRLFCVGNPSSIDLEGASEVTSLRCRRRKRNACERQSVQACNR